MTDSITIVTSDFVKVNVSNSKNDSVAFERKFTKGITINELKSKLEITTGGCAGTMQLELYSGDKLITKLGNGDSMLGSYPIEDGMRIHVIDNFLFVDETVEKFELTTEQYDKKSDTLRNFLKTNRMGKYDEAKMQEIEEKKQQAEKEEDQLLELAVIGSRCRITTKGKPRRLGTVMFKGTLDGKRGRMIGVKLDEPLGSNDGTVDGKRYFECAAKYGSFVSPSAVEIGDFPVENFDLDEEI